MTDSVGMGEPFLLLFKFISKTRELIAKLMAEAKTQYPVVADNYQLNLNK